MTKHFTLSISGLVQDVFFRDTAKEVAGKLGVFGYIKNELDGTVYAEIEGDEKATSEFTAWCHRGPELARVEKVEAKEGTVEGFTHFEIKL